MVMEHRETTPVHEERVRRILADVGADLKARQAKVLLSTEIRKLEREIAFASDRLEVSEAQAAPLETELAAAEPEVAALLEETQALQAQRAKLAARVLDLEHSLDEKTKGMPKFDADIARLERELPSLPPRLKEFEARREELRARKSQVEAQAGPILEALDALEAELLVVGSTRDIIAGLVPSDIDPDVFASIQDDTQARLDEYMHDVRSAIASVSTHNESMKAELGEIRKERGWLSLRKEALERKLQGLDPAALEGNSLESLTREVERLRAEASSLDERRQSAVTTTQSAQLEGMMLDDSLALALEHRDSAEDRLLELSTIKTEFDAVGDVAAAIAAFEAQVTALEAATRLNEALLREGEALVGPLRALRAKLLAEREQMQGVVAAFENLLQEEVRTP